MTGILQALLASVSAAVSAVTDEYFEYVTMLLPGNGTNGAQNNTFLDSSSNNFTITRNGNTTQGTFSPYGDNWSNYFDGTGDYLDAGTNAALGFGTGDFTVEAWIYRNASGSFPIYTNGPTSSGSWAFYVVSDKLQTDYYGGTSLTGATTLTTNAWNHVAVVRSGSTLSLYLNGSRDATTTTTSNNTTSNGMVGRDWTNASASPNGYISNFRVVKGSAVYSGTTYTVPTAPLTAITNTSLLTCQSNRFIDNSTNAFTIGRNGDVSVQRFSPFSPTAAYASGTIGGSGYFDGTGDYLQATAGAVDAIGTGDFQISGWWYLNELKDYQILFDFRNGTNNENVPYIYVPASGTPDYYVNAVSRNFSAAMKAKEWTYILVSRVGSTTKAFMNGVEVLSFTDSTNYVAGRLTLGFNNNGSGSYFYYNGYIAGFRVVVGTGTTSGTVPTSPPTAVTNTKALLNFTNAGIIDNAMMNDLETVGNAQISTSVSKFGGGSMYFDGTGDYLVNRSATADLNAFGTGDFTIEFWLYFAVLPGSGDYAILFDCRPLSTQGIYPDIYFDGSTKTIRWFINSADRITGTTALSATTWYHVAVARSGTSTKMFLNGTQEGSTYTDSNSYLCPANRPIIAGFGFDPTTYSLNGYIDDLRITKGVARYTANFTAPTAPFADQ